MPFQNRVVQQVAPPVERRACIFVDYENIRISLRENFRPQVDATAIAKVLKEIAANAGSWRGGKAYANWARHHKDARAFEDVGFETRMVLPKRSGTDRSDMVMSAEILECIYQSSDLDTIVVGSGDADFQDVIRRVKDKGLRVVVAACTPNTAWGLISMADQFVPVEKELGLTPKDEAEAETLLPGRDWSSLIILMARLETENRFVGGRRLGEEWLGREPERYGESKPDRRRFIEDALKEEILVSYDESVETDAGSRRTWAVRLNREHPVVRTVLGQIEEKDEEKAEAGAEVSGGNGEALKVPEVEAEHQ